MWRTWKDVARYMDIYVVIYIERYYVIYVVRYMKIYLLEIYQEILASEHHSPRGST